MKNAMGDAFKKMRKGKKPAEGSPAEEATESPMQEKLEDKGETDRAPTINPTAGTNPIHGDQMHGEAHSALGGLHPDHLIEILKSLLGHSSGAPTFDSAVNGSISKHINLPHNKGPKGVM